MSMMSPPTPASFAIFAQLLKRHAGLNLRPEKSYLLAARLSSILRREDNITLDALAVRLTGAEPGLMALEREIVEAMLNHETFFFRDILPFEELERSVYPRLKTARAASRRISIWCAACATGQEPFSIAIQLAEQRAPWTGWDVDILASDISHRALARAKSGAYTQFEVQRGLSTERLLMHFNKEGESWRILDDIRRRVRFEQRNLCAAPPPGRKFDIVFARNVLMYLGKEEKARALDNLRRSLADDGVLILGAAETVFGQADIFHPDQTCRGYYAPVIPGVTPKSTTAGPRPYGSRTDAHPSGLSPPARTAAR
ncbi:MAG: protein-glutamate O-methyltransferase CheR [Pacificimonas sp.]